MASNRVHGRGLRSSTLPSLTLVFTVLTQITLPLSGTKSDIVVLVVYVDILLTGSDSAGLLETKKYFKRHFMTKDMRRPEYFLGIEVVHQKYNTLLSQRKYALDLLEQDSWGASLIALQWKPMWTYGLMTVTHLMIHEDIGD